MVKLFKIFEIELMKNNNALFSYENANRPAINRIDSILPLFTFALVISNYLSEGIGVSVTLTSLTMRPLADNSLISSKIK